jgi:hypothetical protein
MHSTHQTGITALLDRNKQSICWETTGVPVLCALGVTVNREKKKNKSTVHFKLNV